MDEPQYVAEVAADAAAELAGNQLPMACPRAQAGVVSQRKDTPEAFDIMKMPVVDESRQMPENFSLTMLETYKRLPTRSLPMLDKKLAGKFNFTIKDMHNAAIEVHDSRATQIPPEWKPRGADDGCDDYYYYYYHYHYHYHYYYYYHYYYSYYYYYYYYYWYC